LDEGLSACLFVVLDRCFCASFKMEMLDLHNSFNNAGITGLKKQ
jgi:hypothetical protein